MRAVVLVGGFGTRLRPLTSTTPKQMLPVVGVPMIEHVAVGLAAHGIDDVVLSLGYRPDAFIEAYPDGTCGGVRLHYATEPEPLDTAGAIRFAACHGGIDDTFVVVNGDVLTDLSVTDLIAAHGANGGEGTIALTPVEDPSRYGVVPLEDDDRVSAFVEKPPPGEAPSNWINAGTYVLEPSVLDRIAADRPVSIEREVFPEMVRSGSLFGRQDDAYWADAGTPETYLQVQLDLIDGARPVRWDAVDPTAEIAATASVRHSVIGAGANIADGAVVVDAVILGGARVERGARVEGSIVGPDAVVGDGAAVGDLTVLGAGAAVEPAQVLSGARVPDPALADH
ncbi:MAG: NDP-sugar synthase [Acidimicrobiia bacterium]|nr:NDP-sugar synthase [Acidimicrobiia bacterium]